MRGWGRGGGSKTDIHTDGRRERQRQTDGQTDRGRERQRQCVCMCAGRPTQIRLHSYRWGRPQPGCRGVGGGWGAMWGDAHHRARAHRAHDGRGPQDQDSHGSHCYRRCCCCWYPGWVCEVCSLVGCFTSQQQASVSQGRICSYNCTCCHTEIEVADQTSCVTQSQYADTGSTSPSADSITPGTWQGGHCSANVWVTGMTRPGNIPQTGIEPWIFRSRGGRLNH